MRRLTFVSSCFMSLYLLLTIGSVGWSVEPPPPPPPAAPGGPRSMPRQPTGMLIKVSDDAITVRAPGVQKGAAPRAAKDDAGAKPAPAADDAPTQAAEDQSFKQTRVSIEEVTAERMTNVGQRIRSIRYDAGELADLEAGQLVEVVSSNGVATRIVVMDARYVLTSDAWRSPDAADQQRAV